MIDRVTQAPPITIRDHVGVDFEGTTIDGWSLKTVGVYNYLHAPEKQETFMVAICTDDPATSFVGHPADYDWTLIDGKVWAAHNSSFDEQVFKALIDLGILKGKQALVRPSQWVCTSALAAFMRSKRNLKDATWALIPEWNADDPEDVATIKVKKTIRKLMHGKTVAEMKALIMPDGRTLYEHAEEYCWTDALSSWELWARYGIKWPAVEQRISALTSLQSQRGFRVDVELLHSNLDALNYACDYAKSQLDWMRDEHGNVLATDDGVLSIPQLKACIVDNYHIEPPKTTSEDTEACRAWERQHPECKLVHHMRAFRKLNILRRRHEYVADRLITLPGEMQGRFQFAWMYGGAHTLRWAGGSSYRRGGTGEEGFNVQNINKEPLFIEESGELIQDHDRIVRLIAGEEQAYYGIDGRALIVAPPGKKLLIADAEQIEARITLWLAGEVESLKKVAAGMSVYEVHMRKSMGWTGGDPKKENPRKYFLGKNRVLALGFGCGWKKFFDRCRELGFPIPAFEAKHEVDDFRAKEKKIKACWDKHDQALHKVAYHNDKVKKGLIPGPQLNYEVPLPSGRVLTYFKPHHHCGYPYANDADKEKAKKKGTYSNRVQVFAKTEVNGNWTSFYGGKIFENEVQSIARDVLAEKMILTMDDEGHSVLFTSHDEVVAEVDDDTDPMQVKRTIDQVELPWAQGLPISVSVMSSQYYTK